MTTYPYELIERLKQKWLLEEFPGWLQERVIAPLFVQSTLPRCPYLRVHIIFLCVTYVPNMEVDEPKSRPSRVMASDRHPIVKRMNAFVTHGYRFHT